MNKTAKTIIKTLDKQYFHMKPGFTVIYTGNPGIDNLIVTQPDTWKQTEIKLGKYCIKVGWGFMFVHAGYDANTNILVIGSGK